MAIKIYIDQGHNPQNPNAGAEGNGLREQDLTYRIGVELANLINSIKTPAYITTYDKDGNAMDKTKLELGDDPNKTGVYEMSFTVNNIGNASLSGIHDRDRTAVTVDFHTA